MEMIMVGEVNLHYRIEGDPRGKPIVFANSLGTDFRLWDKIIPLLPHPWRCWGMRSSRFVFLLNARAL